MSTDLPDVVRRAREACERARAIVSEVVVDRQRRALVLDNLVKDRALRTSMPGHSSDVDRRLRAAQLHDSAAVRHEAAARYWDERGQHVQAELERRNAELERAAARLERDRAQQEE